MSVDAKPMPIHVLLIEDNAFDRELTTRALRGLAPPDGPPAVTAVEDWPGALAVLETGTVDLVLLDYHLPGMTGMDVLRALDGRPRPPVVMLTGQGDVAVAVETLRAGAHDYVPKGTDLGATLCLTIDRVLAHVRLERDLADARARLADYAADLERKVEQRTAVLRAQAVEIEALYLKTEEAQRLKSNILANLSHELRTPLNVVLGYTELLQDTLPGGDGGEAGALLDKVHTQADHLRRLVDSLLALSQLDRGIEGTTLSRFPLAVLAEELRADALVLTRDRALEVEWTIEPGDVETDRDKLRAIAYHLVSNAIKFTPEGRVAVGAAPTPDGGVRLRVSDTGIGLPAEALAVAFAAFEQVDGSSTRRFEGLGLGLGIVKRYTALLRGTIDVDGAPQRGTTIVVTLPGPAQSAVAAATP